MRAEYKLFHTLILLSCLLLLAGTAAAAPASAALTPDPNVQAMLDQVQRDTLYSYVAGLSGEKAVTIGGAPVTLATRSTAVATSIEKATQYVYEHFQALGLPVSYHTWSYYGSQRRNVVAEQAGADPSCVYLLTAHLDSTSPQALSLAPGADDNASGSAGVMAAADILSRYQFTCTLRYVLFTGEEQGLLGSAAYAAAAAARGDPIKGVLNLDMIAYNTSGSTPTAEMDVRSGTAGSQDRVMSNLLMNVVTAYSINLAPAVFASDDDGSDHYSFWQAGYPAVLIIEDWDDHTPYYHTTSDRVSTLNMDYYTQYVKAILGTAAHLAVRVSNPPGNTPPTTADNSRTILEDTQAVFAVADFPFSDVDSGSSLQGIQIAGLPAAGTLYLDANSNGQVDAGETLVAGAVLTTASLARLKFMPAIDANGSDYASFTFKVYDGSAYSSPATFTIHVTPVNDAPSCNPINAGSVNVLISSGPYASVWATNLRPGPPDESGQTLAVALTQADDPTLFSAAPQLILDASSGVVTLRFTPAPGAAGTAHLSAIFTDSDGAASPAYALTITITSQPWHSYLPLVTR